VRLPENKFLREVFGLKRKEITGGQLHIKELHNC
jgi:hypothetical protein